MRGALLLLLLLVARAGAQIVEVPPFVAGTPTFNDHLQDADVAVGTDGTMLFIWGEYGDSIASSKAAVHRFSRQGQPLGPILRADTSGHVFSPVISSDTRGGYVGAWQWIITGQDYEFFSRRFDATGAGVGSDFQADLEDSGSTQSGAVAGLPSGAVVLWRQLNHLWGRLYDTAGQVRGNPFVIGDVGAGFDVDVDTLPDGGFVAVWTDSSNPTGNQSWARLYRPDGQPRAAAFPVHGEPWVHHVAANPLGGIAAAGNLWDAATTTGKVWVRRFTDDGTLTGEDVIEASEPNVVPEPDLAFDGRGNLFVVWSEYLYESGELLPTRARGYDVSGAPLGPPFTINDDPLFGAAYRPRTAWLHDQSFVISWYRYERAEGEVISLCTPGIAVCGDGVLASQCEQCDDGAANSDTAPDACRTDCRRARCGDGVVDSGEECDDRNTRDGDCCSSTCRREPDTDGDGICDPGDNCPIFPNPDQMNPEVCAPQSYEKLAAADETRFEEGLEEFADIETPETGLGPVFNGASCAECHNHPTIGGSSDHFVTRFGRWVGGVFDPMPEHGGSLVQAKGITTDTCTAPPEVVPAEATVSTRRDTPALFGLGLVDAIPDERILRYADPADRNHDGISGRPNLIGGRVGRFGWKAQVVSLHDFSGEAYLNEMGITSPAFPTESSPQGGPVVCDAVPDPEDDGSNVDAFTDFMTLLAPLAPGPQTTQVRLGRRVFRHLKCGSCHLDKLRTGPSPVPALNRKRVRAFSDFLLHDMGPADADGIAQGDASGSEFRTAPLWGVGKSGPYLHDGRAATLEEAIAAHGGEAQALRDGFLALPAAERAALVAYLESL